MSPWLSYRSWTVEVEVLDERERKELIQTSRQNRGDLVDTPFHNRRPFLAEDLRHKRHPLFHQASLTSTIQLTSLQRDDVCEPTMYSTFTVNIYTSKPNPYPQAGKEILAASSAQSNLTETGPYLGTP
jgi:hypothetical protein